MSQAYHGALAPGSRLESYEIQAILGVGGFGITYKGRDENLHCDVAIKEYLPQGLALRAQDGIHVAAKSDGDRKYYEYGLKRFLDEARILAKFKERSIVRVSRFLEANGTAYLVMDYEDGESLAQHLARVGALNERELRAVLVPVLEGLRAVHAKDVLHRDIKPGNIFLRQDGPPVLLDFGAARQALGEQTRTMTGIVTPGYAPFEQYGALGRQGPWTDLYALGATMYHCITGKAPVDAPDRIAALQDGSPDPLLPAAQAGAARFKPELLGVIDWMLVPGAKDRPQSAADVLGRLNVPGAPTMRLAAADFPKTRALGATSTAVDLPPPSAPPATRDQIAAFKANHETAQRGDAAAQYQLGMMYAYGRGTEKDETLALDWLRRAAEQNHATAQARLGLMLARGIGAPRNEAAAAEWLHKAADQGDIAAQFNLGMMYAHGLGVPQDKVQAIKWYRVAALRGHAGAATNLNVLEAQPGRWRRWLKIALIAAATLAAALVLRQLMR